MTKFQKLTRKEKIEHIWEYYRFHIIAGIVGIFMVSSLLITIFGPKPPDPLVNVVIMGAYRHDDEKIGDFKADIEDIIDQGEEGKVVTNIFPVNWDSATPMDVAMNQKLMLMFQVREIDVMIIEERKFDSFIDNLDETIYEPLEGKAEIAGILEANEDKLVKRKLAGDLEEKVYGIQVKDNKKLEALGLGDDYIISVPFVSQKKENALKTIKWLCE